MTPKDFSEKLAGNLFGMTAAEAKAIGCCIQCKKPAFDRCYSEAGKREFQISGLCEICFDSICGE